MLLLRRPSLGPSATNPPSTVSSTIHRPSSPTSPVVHPPSAATPFVADSVAAAGREEPRLPEAAADGKDEPRPEEPLARQQPDGYKYRGVEGMAVGAGMARCFQDVEDVVSLAIPSTSSKMTEA